MQKGILRTISNMILLIGAVSLVRSTVGQGTDFLVFWKAGRGMLQGTPVYDLYLGGMIFKYPPWISPFFLPVSLFSFETAKWIWGLVGVGSLALVIRCLDQGLGVSRKVWFPLLCLYWGLWCIHALDGQIILPLLALGMWVMTTNSRAWPLAALAFTAKIFTVFPFALLVLKSPHRFFRLKFILSTLVLLFCFTALPCYLSYHGDWALMFKIWHQAAVSGALALDPGLTRGSKNQSLTSYFCRILGISAANTGVEILFSISFYVASLALLYRKLKRLKEVEVWMIGLALTGVFHPLSWHHLHIWSFPLAAYGLNLWLKSRRPISGMVYFLALFLITLSHVRALGSLGYFMEYNVGRAWGALLLVIWFVQEINQSIERDTGTLAKIG